MSIMRIISDVHGCITKRHRFQDLPSYIELCQELGPNDYSVQLGDLGFNYTELNILDHTRHKFVAGNHDNYDSCFHSKCCLGNFGLQTLGPFKFYFVRGGFSIDKKARVRDEVLHGQKSWWDNEELSHAQGLTLLEEYERIKPDVVLSHDCPSSISFLLGNPEMLLAFGWPRNMITSSQELMQQMIEIHSPKLWIFGHYHKNWEVTYHKTRFMCLAERQHIDFDKNWEIVGRTGLTERVATV